MGARDKSRWLLDWDLELRGSYILAILCFYPRRLCINKYKHTVQNIRYHSSIILHWWMDEWEAIEKDFRVPWRCWKAQSAVHFQCYWLVNCLFIEPTNVIMPSGCSSSPLSILCKKKTYNDQFCRWSWENCVNRECFYSQKGEVGDQVWSVKAQF